MRTLIQTVTFLTFNIWYVDCATSTWICGFDVLQMIFFLFLFTFHTALNFFGNRIVLLLYTGLNLQLTGWRICFMFQSLPPPDLTRIYWRSSGVYTNLILHAYTYCVWPIHCPFVHLSFCSFQVEEDLQSEVTVCCWLSLFSVPSMYLSAMFRVQRSGKCALVGGSWSAVSVHLFSSFNVLTCRCHLLVISHS